MCICLLCRCYCCSLSVCCFLHTVLLLLLVCLLKYHNFFGRFCWMSSTVDYSVQFVYCLSLLHCTIYYITANLATKRLAWPIPMDWTHTVHVLVFSSDQFNENYYIFPCDSLTMPKHYYIQQQHQQPTLVTKNLNPFVICCRESNISQAGCNTAHALSYAALLYRSLFIEVNYLAVASIIIHIPTINGR